MLENGMNKNSAVENSATANKNIVIVNAGTSDPSTTQMLASRIAEKTAALLPEQLPGQEYTFTTINLKTLAGEIFTALTTGRLGEELEKASAVLGEAPAIIASTPIYKAGASALFTGFFQVLDNDLLIGKPVLLAATAGSARHSLVVDQEIRSLFAYLRTIVTPTSLFATPEDWASSELSSRVDRASAELVALINTGFADTIRENTWQEYQHSYGSAGGTELSIDLDSDLMRLATGG